MSEEIYPNDDPATGPDAAAAADAAAPQEAAQPAAQGRYARLTSETGGVRKLTGMYKNWFLDYASYVILERAVPHVGDGLKPVQRRILHAMKVIDDGRYNKVANIVGQTMRLNPHGDQAIYETMVRLAALCMAGRYREAANLQAALMPAIDALFCEVNPIPVKAAMELLGLCSGELRLPLCRISERHLEQLSHALEPFRPAV